MKFSTTVKRRRYVDALWIWRKQVRDCIQMRKKSLIACEFQNLSLLSTCLVNWRLGMQIYRREQHFQRLALGYWAHGRLSVAWQGLVRFVDMRHVILKLSGRRLQRLKTLFFQHWLHSTLMRMTFTLNVKDILVRMEKSISLFDYNCGPGLSGLSGMDELRKHACSKLLQKSFTALQRHVLQRKSHKEKEKKALRFHHGQSMYCACKAWRDCIHYLVTLIT
jgi:hypothetical protein